MFTFLNTTILLSLIAVVIPLLIHLLNRQRKKNVRFSTIRFLKILEKHRLRRLKLYQYLLILIRTLIILFLVLAFARPTFTGQSLIGGGARTTAVVVIDDAVYMRRYDEDGNRFYRAQKKAEQILEYFHPEDQVFLLSSHAPENELIDIKNLECSFSIADWPGVFARAHEIFAENPNFNQELFIISDFQFREPNWNRIINLENVRVYLFPIARGKVYNVSIDTVRFENTLFEIDNIVRLEAVLRNQNSESVIDAECHLYVNDTRVAHQRVNLNVAESKSINLTFQPKSRGEIRGFVELSDDDLIADNRYYFAFHIPEKFEVLYVDDAPSIYWKAAWKAVESYSNIVIFDEKYNSWGRQPFNRFQTICLVNPPIISEAITQRLRQYVEEGGGLILIPGMNTLPTEFNRLCQTLKIETQMRELIQSQDNMTYYTLKPPSLNHPIFSDLFRLSNPELTKPVFQKYFRFSKLPNQLPILAFNNGDPFLFQADKSVIIMASSLDESWTDLQYRGLFIPLFVRVIYLSSATSTQKNIKATVGQETVLTFDHISQDNFELVQPDGNQYRIAPISFDPRIIFLLNQLNSPGQYSLLSGSTRLQTISVNVAAREIVQKNADYSTLLKNGHVFAAEDQFSESLQQARVGFELWKWALITVILLLIAEIMLIKKTEGKN